MQSLAEWTHLQTAPTITTGPITEIIIQAMTTKGEGEYEGKDRFVWVDDFELDIQPPKSV